MNTVRYSMRPRARWRALVTLCGALGCLTATAQAQKLGTVLGVPLADLERFRRANAVSGVDGFGQQLLPNDVTLLHVSAGSAEPSDPTIATVSVTVQGSGQRAYRVYFPLDGDGTMPAVYRQINANDFFTHPRIVGGGNPAVVSLEVRQSRAAHLELESVRFLLVPSSKAHLLAPLNPKAKLASLHRQRMGEGSEIPWVQMIAVDIEGASGLKVPADLVNDIQTLNSNVIVTSGGLLKVN